MWPVGEPRDPEEGGQELLPNSRSSWEATRQMLPFALLVFVFLILVFKFINRSESDSGNSQMVDCGEGSHQIQISSGDTCWQIGQEHSLGVDELLKLQGNELIDCDNLRVGQAMCVPNKE